MSKGFADWGVNSGGLGNFSMDSAELAARLGSIYRFSRSGKVIVETNFRDDFENWGVPVFGTMNLSTYVYDGIFNSGCLRAYNSAAGAATVTALRYFPYINDSIYGLEFGYRRSIISNEDFYVIFEVSDGSHIDYYDLKFDKSSNDIEYQTGIGVWSKVKDLPTNFNFYPAFCIIKILYDIPNRQIKTIQLNGLNLDISPVPAFRQTIGGISPSIQVGYTVDSDGSASVDVRLSHTIVTYDEIEV